MQTTHSHPRALKNDAITAIMGYLSLNNPLFLKPLLVILIFQSLHFKCLYFYRWLVEFLLPGLCKFISSLRSAAYACKFVKHVYRGENTYSINPSTVSLNSSVISTFIHMILNSEERDLEATEVCIDTNLNTLILIRTL